MEYEAESAHLTLTPPSCPQVVEKLTGLAEFLIISNNFSMEAIWGIKIGGILLMASGDVVLDGKVLDFVEVGVLLLTGCGCGSFWGCIDCCCCCSKWGIDGAWLI